MSAMAMFQQLKFFSRPIPIRLPYGRRLAHHVRMPFNGRRWGVGLSRCSIQQSNDRNRNTKIGPPLNGTLEQVRRLAISKQISSKLVGRFYAHNCCGSVNSLPEPRRNRTPRFQTYRTIVYRWVVLPVNWKTMRTSLCVPNAMDS